MSGVRYVINFRATLLNWKWWLVLPITLLVAVFAVLPALICQRLFGEHNRFSQFVWRIGLKHFNPIVSWVLRGK